eukprot:m.230471 g.230471  ORF g.230471 m.230471 type:complete len:74 (+) comp40059_c0_seq44:285-506(+)
MGDDSRITEFHIEGRLIDIVNEQWKKEKLSSEEISIAEEELPLQDDDLDESDFVESFKDQEKRWKDLAKDKWK